MNQTRVPMHKTKKNMKQNVNVDDISGPTCVGKTSTSKGTKQFYDSV